MRIRYRMAQVKALFLWSLRNPEMASWAVFLGLYVLSVKSLRRLEQVIFRE